MTINRRTRTLFRLMPAALAIILALATGVSGGTLAAGPAKSVYASPRLSGALNSPLVPSTNMVTNGDFETGSLSPNWTTMGTATTSINTDPAFAHGGASSAKISTSALTNVGLAGGGSCAGGSRIPVTAGNSYTWSGWIMVSSSSVRFQNARIKVGRSEE